MFIGTMNTADRSIRSIDVALRRRFEFFPCPPSSAILNAYYARDHYTNHVPSLLAGFDALNASLESARDKHHTIGHAFFMKPEMNTDELRRVWSRQIEPLLEDYFYDEPDVVPQSFGAEQFWPELKSPP